MSTRMETLTRIAWNWGVRCFGLGHMTDWTLRALRFGEESVEVMQSLGVTRDKAHQLVDMVYDRPVGEIERELGGSLVTLACLCHSRGESMEDLLEREIQRVLSKSPDHFRQRNQEKVELLK